MKIGGTGSDGVNIHDQSSLEKKSLKRNYGDDARSEVILDGADNIYFTSSTSSTDFPVTAGAFQTVLGGKQDAVVVKIDPTCSSVIFSTFLGGTGDDAGYVLAMGSTGNIYVAGGTNSNDLKGISSSGVVKSTYSALPGAATDEADGYIIELNPTGTAAIRGTYIGTDKPDQIYGIEIDKGGFVYVMGTSEGNMPVINANYSVSRSKQFISKLQPDLSDFVYSTVFGSANAAGPNISPTAFLVDRCENVYVSGWGGKGNHSFSKSSTTLGMPVTPDAIKPVSDPTGSDFYFFVLKKNADSQLYGTFYGQNDISASFGDHVDGGTSRFDRNGIIYQAICANCGNNVTFNGTPGSWSPKNMATTGGACNLGMLKIEMDFTGVKSAIQSSIGGVPNDSIGCASLTVQFRDTLEMGKRYYWNFEDGTGDTTVTPSIEHVFENVGNYRVRLITIDSSTCNISDTSYVNIKVGNNKVVPGFVSEKLAPCTNLAYEFTNTSVPTFGGFNPDTFTWDFGDGTPPVTQSFTPAIKHTYAGPGTYDVKLTINDTTFCNSPKDTIKSIRLSPEVTSIFSTPATGCVPYTAGFVNNSLGGLRFEWSFGDGTFSDEITPAHLYANPGTYTVTLKAFDSTSCNLEDESSFTVTVSANPTATFTYSPLQPEENTATNFVNQSLGATSYLWNFSDGDSSTMKNPSHFFPATGSYNVCLQAKNDAGCIDTACVEVKSLIRPLLDVPTGFTPGAPGVNSIIKVEGFGIQQMTWSIYNRWGQKVFETTSRKMGWDGTYKGKLQPMDVYTYTLDVTFSDGLKVKKTGDITLIR